ncbi:Kinesin light chain [Fasciola hepatica]|uniref:Kinesin light chain n=1 Tax=Fasciola hepatica TaxID=6192 RepID=A0A4E0QU99_FASHE|nr:Kinesin light chain [Fasciola hepatica]
MITTAVYEVTHVVNQLNLFRFWFSLSSYGICFAPGKRISGLFLRYFHFRFNSPIRWLYEFLFLLIMMGMPAYVKENLKNAQLILESLKHDHERALKALDAFVQCTDGGESRTGGELVTTSDPNNVYNQEKLPLIKSALKQIQDGLDDSEVLVTFAKYVECLEAENMRLSLHNQRLCEETGWLRDELKYTQAKLGENEAILAEALVEKRHLEFMLDLRRYEEPVNGVVTENDRVLFEKSLGPGTSLHPSMAASVLGLTSTPNVYHPLQDYRNGVLHSPTISMNSSQNLTMSMDLMHSSLLQGDMGSVLCTQSFHPSLIDRSSPNEPRTSFSLAIPPRLRTIHQIVMQYTNQGKHGVAASLCLQAITDLERSGGRDQPEVAVLLNILALVYRDQGRYEEAAKLLQKVVSIRERTLGPNHPAVSDSFLSANFPPKLEESSRVF